MGTALCLSAAIIIRWPSSAQLTISHVSRVLSCCIPSPQGTSGHLGFPLSHLFRPPLLLAWVCFCARSSSGLDCLHNPSVISYFTGIMLSLVELPGTWTGFLNCLMLSHTPRELWWQPKLSFLYHHTGDTSCWGEGASVSPMQALCSEENKSGTICRVICLVAKETIVCLCNHS